MTMRGIIRHDQGRLNAASLDDFPDDILMEILSRVPAHELVMKKAVCKTWRRLIADRYFARLHLHRATLVTLVLTYSESRGAYYAILRTIHNLFKKKKIQIVPLPASRRTKLEIVAYCDGLFIGTPMTRYKDPPIDQHFIFNPATGEQRAMARLGENQCAGFYYHPPSNKYRLLCCSPRLQDGMFHYYTRSIIHRKHRRQEKEVGMFENQPGTANANLILGGFLYSISSSCLDCGKCVMRFDIYKEELQFIPHPGEPCLVCNKLHLLRMQLMCIKDKLGMFIINQTASDADVWILEDPSTWSWNRKFSIDLKWCCRLGRFPVWSVDVLSFNDDGEYTFYCSKGIYHYHPSSQRVVKIHQDTFFVFLGSHFKFSLISPRDVF